MTSTQSQSGGFLLTPHQQRLLFEALNANKATSSPLNRNLSSFETSPNQGQLFQGQSSLTDIQDSPLLDLDYDISATDTHFDFSFDDGENPRMIGDLPGAPSITKSDSTEADAQDKRSHPEDDDDDEENGAKRRESEDKVAKKPGRKPLTTEPSNKRKAQNRAAQRAFRERKERHLKDLETRVEELVKASEATNHENGILRAKMEKMSAELAQYKKRLASLSTGRPAMSHGANPPAFGQAFINNLNDVNFQFEFPKFGGALPGPPSGVNGANNKNSLSAGSTPASNYQRDSIENASPQDNQSPGSLSSFSPTSQDRQKSQDLASLSGSLFNSNTANNGMGSTSRSSVDSHYGTGAGTSSSSPASSNSNMGGGPSSSCGTSPEPYTQSPMGFKPVDTLTTIGEEQPTLTNSNQDFGHFANIDIGDFNWLPQNNFQFDPQLFNEYREPRDNLFSGIDVDESFFNDAINMDFPTPYNLPMSYNAPKKKDLVAEIDDAKNADALDKDGQLLTCTKIWETLQNCPKVQSGDFDLDGLCSDLQKKAKCSGSGAVVDESDFKSVMQKYLSKTDQDTPGCDPTKKPTTVEK